MYSKIQEAECKGMCEGLTRDRGVMIPGVGVFSRVSEFWVPKGPKYPYGEYLPKP